MTEWEPVTEAEAAMRDALRANDQELYFRILARTELLLPVSAEAIAGRTPMGWGTWTTGGRTHVLAFTSSDTLTACLGENAGATRRMPYQELADTWPNLEWWLAVNPGLPIEGYLPAWFVSQLARGDVRLPGRTAASRARPERAASVAPARATASVPAGTTAPDQGSDDGHVVPAAASPPSAAPALAPRPTPSPRPAVPAAAVEPSRTEEPPRTEQSGRTEQPAGVEQSGRGESQPAGVGAVAAPASNGAAHEPARPSRPSSAYPGTVPSPAVAVPSVAAPPVPAPPVPVPAPPAPLSPQPAAVTVDAEGPPPDARRAATSSDAAVSTVSEPPTNGSPRNDLTDPSRYGAAEDDDDTLPAGPADDAGHDPAPSESSAPESSASPALPNFDPANEVEASLLAAAGGGSTDTFLSTLLLAKVLLPVADSSAPAALPGDEGFVWRTEILDGETYVVVFTSPQRLADHLGEPVETATVKFVQLIRKWPDPSWSFAVNPATPVGAKLPGGQILALASWAAEVGLRDDAESEQTEPGPVEEPTPRSAYAPAKEDPDRPTMMQKTIAASQLDYYLERGYDRVSGFVHRANEVAHLTTPAKLHAALGLGYAGSPFARSADETYVLRWPAYRPSLYRIPYGGQNEAAMRAMEGWVIERAPFRGNGFAPGDSNDVIAEFKVDSARLPHGSQLWRIRADGSETLVAVLDCDTPVWRRVAED
ncbi:SseB family protein [Micromonospora sp. NPDC049679]|uniref:SseB family protein n=1 Tax=Micromonospora sp. NPDC049679 TaxID=3155920 RepID=UPI0034055313